MLHRALCWLLSPVQDQVFSHPSGDVAGEVPAGDLLRDLSREATTERTQKAEPRAGLNKAGVMDTPENVGENKVWLGALAQAWLEHCWCSLHAPCRERGADTGQQSSERQELQVSAEPMSL